MLATVTESQSLITTVVPFYQTTSGILINSINSVIKQTVLASHQIEIIIVDDGSPLSAESELKELSLPESCSLQIIAQKNRGPAAARNRGLDEVKSTTKFIAFLDSDDIWSDNHLSNAVKALGDDADFYFSDFYQLDQKISAFNRAKKINLLDYQKLEAGNFLYIYKGDMINQIVTGNVIGTPTVVYRHDSNPELRFREEFFSAGEDYFFWIDFCTEEKKIVFSSQQECECGKGVNIYTGAEWGTLALLDRILSELKYRKLSLTILTLNDKTQIFVKNKIEALRVEFTQQLIHRLAHRKSGIWPRIKQAYRLDPLTILLFPIRTVKLFLEKLNPR